MSSLHKSVVPVDVFANIADGIAIADKYSTIQFNLMFNKIVSYDSTVSFLRPGALITHNLLSNAITFPGILSIVATKVLQILGSPWKRGTPVYCVRRNGGLNGPSKEALN